MGTRSHHILYDATDRKFGECRETKSRLVIGNRYTRAARPGHTHPEELLDLIAANGREVAEALSALRRAQR
jgi:hypothetical protein